MKKIQMNKILGIALIVPFSVFFLTLLAVCSVYVYGGYNILGDVERVLALAALNVASVAPLVFGLSILDE